MRTIFIKEINNEKNLFKKVIVKMKEIFNIISIVNYRNNKVYLLPIHSKWKNKKHKVNKISNEIIKKLEYECTNRVILSKNIKKIDNLRNNLYSKNINILDGRFLFKCLYREIIDYILNLKKEKLENTEICILVNDYTEINEKIIIDIAEKVKNLNVITNNINKLKKIEKYLYNEYGILINNSNSKKTSLLNAKIILNLDFPEELINKYRINTKAIIINFLEKIEIQSKKFNGININYFKINMPNIYKMEEFSDEEVYESIIYNYNFKEVQDKINKDEIKIKYLIGNKGIILEQEFK